MQNLLIRLAGADLELCACSSPCRQGRPGERKRPPRNDRLQPRATSFRSGLLLCWNRSANMLRNKSNGTRHKLSDWNAVTMNN